MAMKGDDGDRNVVETSPIICEPNELIARLVGGQSRDDLADLPIADHAVQSIRAQHDYVAHVPLLQWPYPVPVNVYRYVRRGPKALCQDVRLRMR